MEEKKKTKNIYGIVSLCLMLLTLILELVGLMSANFILVVCSIVVGITGIVLSIIGIVKSTKIKKQVGKLKGITVSIISIIVILLVLILSIMEFILLIYEQVSGDTEFSSMVNSLGITETTPQYTYETLNDMEKLAYNAVRELYNRVDDEENLTINSIYCQEINTDSSHYYKIYINCTGKNAFNATVKNCYTYRSSGSILGSDISKNWVTIGRKLNVEKIMTVYNNK